MPDITPELLAHLRYDFPNVDLDHLVSTIGPGARSPSALLRHLCRKASEAAVSASAYPNSSSVPNRPPGPAGYWSPTGSWCPHHDDSLYWNAPQGSVTRAIRHLVALRRSTSISPRDAAMLIEPRPYLHLPFPSRSIWVDSPFFHNALAATSAEAAVKYGRSTASISPTPPPAPLVDYYDTP